MSPNPDSYRCIQVDLVALLALGALSPEEQRATQAHIASCAECRQELQALRRVTESLVSWPTDVLRPPDPLWDRISQRVASDTGMPPVAAPAIPERLQPEWEDVAPGISCKVLACDADRGRVSMLVRLAAGAAYPPHTHAGTEELHLLQGELWINDRQLHPGDFSRGEPGTRDWRVWSETGCTCVLITSMRDSLV